MKKIIISFLISLSLIGLTAIVSYSEDDQPGAFEENQDDEYADEPDLTEDGGDFELPELIDGTEDPDFSSEDSDLTSEPTEEATTAATTIKTTAATKASTAITTGQDFGDYPFVTSDYAETETEEEGEITTSRPRRTTASEESSGLDYGDYNDGGNQNGDSDKGTKSGIGFLIGAIAIILVGSGIGIIAFLKIRKKKLYEY